MAQSTAPADLTIDLEPGFAALQLERRLADTPATAHTRGLFFRLAEHAVAERSQDLARVWRVLSGRRSRWPFNLYSTRDFIREMAVAAVLLDTGDPGAALHRMWATTPRLSRLIRAEGFIRYLTRKEPVEALTWLARNRSLMCDYGAWWVTRTGDADAVLHYRDEYIWIEHCYVGGVEGTLQRCGVSARVTIDPDGPYSGRLLIRWD